MAFPRVVFLSSITLLIAGCCAMPRESVIHSNAPWSTRIAESFLAMHPDSIVYEDEAKSRQWNYEQGLMLESFHQMWRHSGDVRYLTYVKKNLDYYIEPDGTVKTYQREEYRLDDVTPGRTALRLYTLTHEDRYRIAAGILRGQLAGQPRTSDGGFWHKNIYPNQMWLDGLYMAGPFYAQYAAMFNDSAAFDDIARQFLLIARHDRDSTTGLFFHGWDESKKQRWANPTTGCSPTLWGRSLGWYAMGLVDVLEYFPKQHPMRNELIKILNDVSTAMLKQRDVKSNLWYQVVDKPGVKGNYLEASVSAMFAYSYAKGANEGYLPHEFFDRAKETFAGILEHLVSIDSTGVVHLEHVCKVGGLGGNPYRDGSVAYYLGEPQRTDDFKGYGALLLAAIEIERHGEKR